MYDTNGNLKQVIRVKCANYDIGTQFKICKLLYKLSIEFKLNENEIETDDIMIVLSLFDGYELSDLLKMLDRRYSK